MSNKNSLVFVSSILNSIKISNYKLFTSICMSNICLKLVPSTMRPAYSPFLLHNPYTKNVSHFKVFFYIYLSSHILSSSVSLSWVAVIAFWSLDKACSTVFLFSYTTHFIHAAFPGNIWLGLPCLFKEFLDSILSLLRPSHSLWRTLLLYVGLKLRLIHGFLQLAIHVSEILGMTFFDRIFLYSTMKNKIYLIKVLDQWWANFLEMNTHVFLFLVMLNFKIILKFI